MKLNEGILLVMIREAFLPGVMEPSISPTPIAKAELIVHALKACSGVSFILMQPRAITNLISPLGDEPGL